MGFLILETLNQKLKHIYVLPYELFHLFRRYKLLLKFTQVINPPPTNLTLLLKTSLCTLLFYL